MYPEVNVVDGCHHALRSCPCKACVRRRELIGHQPDYSGSHLISMPPSVAHLFKYIPRLNPNSSFARRLLRAQEVLGD